MMAGWPSHLDLPAREDGGTSWNNRVDAHGLSVELLDAMWYAAAVDHTSGYKPKCLRWIGPYFPGTTAEERKVQTLEQNNMSSNVKVAVLGPDYIGLCLPEESSDRKSIRRSWVSPAMRVEGWSVSTYDYIDRSWTVDGTYPCGDELGYHHESTGRIRVYALTRDGNGGGDTPGDDQEEEKDDDVEEIIDEDSTHLAFEAELGTTENQEPMDVVEEIPTAHAAVTAPNEEQGYYPPEQKTPERSACLERSLRP